MTLALFAGSALLAWGCSSLKTYYSEYSTLPNTASGPGENVKALPAVEHSEGGAEKPAAPAAGPTPSTAATSQQTQAVAEAVADSNKAAIASAAALKASEAAAQAAAQASKAAARAAGEPSPSAQATPSRLLLSSTSDVAADQQRQHVTKSLEKLNLELGKTDRQKLDLDGQSRVDLAKTFLQSAQKAFADGSYAEADSLATKATAILAPLAVSPQFPN